MQTVRVTINHAGSKLSSVKTALSEAKVDEWVKSFMNQWGNMTVTDSGWKNGSEYSRRDIVQTFSDEEKSFRRPDEEPFIFVFTKKAL
jgi:hypothetical protein